LSNGTDYYFIVTAVNSAGDGLASAEVTATPIAPPAAPGNLAVQAGNTELTLTWDASATASSYNVYWGTSSGVSASNGIKIADVTSPYTHTGLSNGTTYYYVVTAENGVGEGTESAEASGVPSDIGWSTQSNASAEWNLSTSGYTMGVGGLALNDANIGFATFNLDSGSVRNIYATRFSAGSWSTEESIGGVDSSESKITVDATGNATAVWIEAGYDAVNFVYYYDIWANRYSAGTWGTPVRISDTSVGGASFNAGLPQIAADSNGDVIACWRQSEGTIYHTMWCNRYASGAWGSPVQVSLAGQDVLDTIEMDVDGAGKTYLVWNQTANDGSTSENTWLATYTGSVWTGPLLIGSALSVGDLVRSVSLDVNSAGDMAVVWHQTTAGVDTIEAVTYDASIPAWEIPKTVVSVDPLNVAPWDVTLDDSRNVMVFWTQNDTTAVDTLDSGYYSTYVIGGTSWPAGQLLESSSYGDVEGIVADVDSSGKVHVTWPQLDPTYVYIAAVPLWSRAYDSVNGWTAVEHRGRVYGARDMLLDVNNPGNALLYAVNQFFRSLTGFWYVLDASYYNSGT
jgi:fibronectin type 3 domain-containing protein